MCHNRRNYKDELRDIEPMNNTETNGNKTSISGISSKSNQHEEGELRENKVE